MLSFVLDLCKYVIEQVTKNKEIKLETRLRISTILFEISSILQDTADKLKKDEYPHANCVAMTSLSNNLHFILIDLVDMDVLDKLHNLLIEASQVEKQFAIRKEPNTIPMIEEAAGEFKAMSLILKV
jgi:hypothetical protein